MKKLALIFLTAASLAIGSCAFAFQKGEKVTVLSTKQTGTVVEDNGTYVKVHIDASGYSSDVGVWYEKSDVAVNGGAGGATGQPANNVTNGATPGRNTDGTPINGGRITVGKKSGTILEDKGNMLKIHFDDSGYSHDVGVWIEKDKLNENTGATAPAAPVHTPANGAANGAANAGANTAPINHAPAQQNQTPHKYPIDAPNTAQAGDVAVGTPPDGIYTCNKLSVGRLIHIGTIEIRGGTYKGFSSQQGSFHPYTMDGGGNINWTAGLTGMPDGWSLKPGKYVGPDNYGHPRIRIYYTSPRGAAEVVDATKEK